MNFCDLSEVTARGELGARCALLEARLEAPMYRPENVYRGSRDWPGDWPGRTILALSCLSRVSKREPSYLDEIVSDLRGALNARGYLGEILEGQLNEQQLSGHSWLLRGLCEYYLYRKNDETLALIDGIIRGLFLPARGFYETYPIRPEQRVYGGKESGNTAGLIGSWHISTDTGCAYIPLDGVTHAYEILKKYSPDEKRDFALSELLDEMTSNFMKIPFEEIRAQTHATLTGCRGLLRRFAQTGDKTLLDFTEKVFELYERAGMTPAYANFNWFGRPEWTEPCAIIDSYMVAAQLFALTGKANYAESAQLILVNGVFHAQRPNGGFGLESCVVKNGILSMHCYEASWCCSMRGGEGLARAAQYAVLGDGTVLYPMSGDYVIGGKTLSIRSNWPHAGAVRLSLEGGGSLRVFVPSWVKEVKCDCLVSRDGNYARLEIPADAGQFTLELSSELRRDTYKENERFYDGVLLLGCPDTNAAVRFEDIVTKNGKYTANNVPLCTLDCTYLKSEADVNSERFRILF